MSPSPLNCEEPHVSLAGKADKWLRRVQVSEMPRYPAKWIGFVNTADL